MFLQIMAPWLQMTDSMIVWTWKKKIKMKIAAAEKWQILALFELNGNKIWFFGEFQALKIAKMFIFDIFSWAKSTILRSQNFRFGQILKLQSHRFYINSKLSFRICHFSTFRSSEFWLLMIFCTFWKLKITKLKNSELLKWHIWHFLKPQIWFHAKSEW